MNLSPSFSSFSLKGLQSMNLSIRTDIITLNLLILQMEKLDPEKWNDLPELDRC